MEYKLPIAVCVQPMDYDTDQWMKHGQRWAHQYRQLWLNHSPMKKVIKTFCLGTSDSMLNLLNTFGLQSIGLNPQMVCLLLQDIDPLQ